MAPKKTGSSSGSRKSRSSKRASGRSKSAGKAAQRKRGSGKRDLVKTPTGDFFAHRDAKGEFREMDEVGRSLAADRRQKAKTKVASGYGDRGDR